MSVKHLPWEFLSGPIYHPSELRPRKKWVTSGGWVLSVVMIVGGVITPYYMLTVFGVLYVLALLMSKETAVTIRGIEIYYQMRITTHYDFLSWQRVEAMLCDDKKFGELAAVYFTYGDRVKRLFFPKSEAEKVMALAIEQNPKIVIKKNDEDDKDNKDKRVSSEKPNRKRKR